MAATKTKECYVYLLSEGVTPIYVGKGTGHRSKASQRKHGGDISYLETGLCDDDAFCRERHWIAEIKPQNNISAGGNGGRVKPRHALKKPKWMVEIERVGARKYAALFLLTRLNTSNCEHWGVSKVDLSRLREVAHG